MEDFKEWYYSLYTVARWCVNILIVVFVVCIAVWVTRDSPTLDKKPNPIIKSFNPFPSKV